MTREKMLVTNKYSHELTIKEGNDVARCILDNNIKEPTFQRFLLTAFLSGVMTVKEVMEECKDERL